jgi:hypothetical protein
MFQWQAKRPARPAMLHGDGVIRHHHALHASLSPLLLDLARRGPQRVPPTGAQGRAPFQEPPLCGPGPALLFNLLAARARSRGPGAGRRARHSANAARAMPAAGSAVRPKAPRPAPAGALLAPPHLIGIAAGEASETRPTDAVLHAYTRRRAVLARGRRRFLAAVALTGPHVLACLFFRGTACLQGRTLQEPGARRRGRGGGGGTGRTGPGGGGAACAAGVRSLALRVPCPHDIERGGQGGPLLGAAPGRPYSLRLGQRGAHGLGPRPAPAVTGATTAPEGDEHVKAQARVDCQWNSL